MFLSKKGQVFLMKHEGIRTKAYRDPVGILTIGAGFTWQSRAFRKWWWLYKPGQDFTINSTMTPAEIGDALDYMVRQEYGAAVTEWLDGQTVPQHVMDTLISVVWNLGPRALGWSWAKAVKEGDYVKAARLLKNTGTTAKGRKLAGLVRRREEEALLLRMGVYTGVPASKEWQDRNPTKPTIPVPEQPAPAPRSFWQRLFGWFVRGKSDGSI